ncbi:hypothetical protein PFLuk1_02994 [Pseudomonas fluorescens]|nr:hypothetical protein PFLuk1_02994 [Pseudomonas fluorescens]
MSDFSICAASLGPHTVRCNLCTNMATRAQVTYWHQHDPHIHYVYCESCAAQNGNEFCSCCEMSSPFACENEDGVQVYLMPVYGAEVLDSDWMCCEHP